MKVTKKGIMVMVFNATFNNISFILWRSVLLVEEIGGPGETTNLSQVTDKLYYIMKQANKQTNKQTLVILKHCSKRNKIPLEVHRIKRNQTWQENRYIVYYLNFPCKAFSVLITTSVVIGTDYIGCYKSNYHTITAMTVYTTMMTNFELD
jgi:hypothetical protein